VARTEIAAREGDALDVTGLTVFRRKSLFSV
jgi:hypothetical protein